MGKNAHQIAQVGGLVAVEEVLLEVERFEDKVCVFLVQPVLAEKGIVAGGYAGPGRIEDAQIVHSSSSLQSWQKIAEKFLVPLAVKDQHRNPVLVLGRPDQAKRILGDDVLQQSGLARAGRAENDRLHHAR